MPAHLKHPSVRARTNKASTRAVLRPVKNPRVPALPAHVKWFPVVREWWKRAWVSKMTSEWEDSDRDALYLAALLMQQFWDPVTPAHARVSAAGEIRQIMCQCGLTPLARRRLEWFVESGESAQEKTAARRASKAAAAKVPVKQDPRVGRTALHAV